MLANTNPQFYCGFGHIHLRNTSRQTSFFVQFKKQGTKKLFIQISLTTAIYLLKVNNRNPITSCEICSKLTINTLASLLLSLNIFHTLF